MNINNVRIAWVETAHGDVHNKTVPSEAGAKDWANL